MQTEEDRIFQGLFRALLENEARPPSSREVARARFWHEVWLAADASRAYRRRATEWREAGSVDYADQLEAAADAHDDAWDTEIRRHSEHA